MEIEACTEVVICTSASYYMTEACFTFQFEQTSLPYSPS